MEPEDNNNNSSNARPSMDMSLFTGVTIFDEDLSESGGEEESGMPSEKMKVWFSEYYLGLIGFHQQRDKRLREFHEEINNPNASPLSREEKKNLEFEHFQKETSYLRMKRKTSQKEFEPLFLYGEHLKNANKSMKINKKDKQVRRSGTFSPTSMKLAQSPEQRNIPMTPPQTVISRKINRYSLSASPVVTTTTATSTTYQDSVSPFSSPSNSIENMENQGGTVMFKQPLIMEPEANPLGGSGDSDYIKKSRPLSATLESLERRRTKSVSSIKKEGGSGNNSNMNTMEFLNQTPVKSTPVKNKSKTMMFKFDTKLILEETEKLLQEKEEDTRIAAEIGQSLLERNEEMEKEMKMLKSKLLEHENFFKELNTENERLKSENVLLSSNVDTARMENESLLEIESVLHNKLYQQNQWLKSEHSPLKNKTIQQQKEEIEELKSTVESLQESQGKLVKSRDKLKNANDLLQTSMLDLRDQLQDRADATEVDSLKKKISTLRNKNRQLQIQIEQNLNDSSGTLASLAKDPESIIKTAFNELISNEELLSSTPRITSLRVLSDARSLISRLESDISNFKDVSLISTLLKYLEQESVNPNPNNNNNYNDQIISNLNESFESTDSRQLSDPKSALYMLVCIVTIQKYTKYDKIRIQEIEDSDDDEKSKRYQIENQSLKQSLEELESRMEEFRLKHSNLLEDYNELRESTKLSNDQFPSMQDELSYFANQESSEMLEKLKRDYDDQMISYSNLQISSSMEIENIKDINQTLESEIEQLKVSLREKEENIENYINQIEAILKEFEEKEALITKLTDDLSHSQQQMDSVKSNFNSELQKMNQLIEEKSNLLGEKDQAIQDLSSLLAQKTSDFNSINDLYAEKDKQSEQLSLQIQEKMKEIEGLNLQIIDKNNEIVVISNDFRSQLVQLENTLEEKEDTIKQLKQSIIDKEVEIDNLSKEIIAKDSEILELNHTISEKNKQLHANEENLKHNDKEKDHTISNLNKDLLDVKDLINSKEKEIKDLIQNHISQIEELNQSLKLKIDQISELSQLLNHKNTNIDDLTNQIQNLNSNVQDLTTQLASKDKEIQDLSSSKDNEIKELNCKVQSIESQLASKDNEIQMLNSNIQDLNSSKDGLNSKIELLESQLGSKDSEIKELNSRIQSIESQLASKDNEIQMLNSNIQDSKSSKDGLNSKIELLESQLGSKDSEIKELNHKIELKDNEIKEISSSKDNEIKELNSKLESSKELNSNNEKRIELLEEQLKSHNSTSTTLIEQKDSEILALQEQIQQLLNSKKEIESLNSNLKSDNSTLQTSLESLNQSTGDLLKDCLDTLESTMSSKLLEHFESRKSHADKTYQFIKSLQGENESLRTEVEKLLSDIQDLKTFIDIQESNQANEEEAKKTESLILELQNIKEEYEISKIEKSQLQDKINQLESRSQKFKLQKKELSMQLADIVAAVKEKENQEHQEKERNRLEEERKLEMNRISLPSFTSKDYFIEMEKPLVEFINSHLVVSEEIPESMFPINFEKHILYSFYDGVLLCKLVNFSRPDTIDERVMNLKPSSKIEVEQNLNLVINSAKAIGCLIPFEINPLSLLSEDPTELINLIYELVKVYLSTGISASQYPSLMVLKTSKEPTKLFIGQSASQLLHRWILYHLDIKKSKQPAEGYLLQPSNLITLLSKLDNSISLGNSIDEASQIDLIFNQLLSKFDIYPWLTKDYYINKNLKLLNLFIINLFKSDKGIGIKVEETNKADQEELKKIVELSFQDIEGTREERAFCIWLNSLNINPYVNNLQQDLQDGLVILQMFDKINPGCFSWTKDGVHLHPSNAYQELENCNIGIRIAKKMGFSLVGIDGKNIHDCNRKLTLSVIWQACKYHYLSILQSLRTQFLTGDNSKKEFSEVDITNWANNKVKSIGKSTAILGFKDPTISTGKFLLDLLEAVQPGTVNYSLVKEASTNEEKKLNAQYIINSARKIGCYIFVVEDDIVEVKQKMLMTLVATLMTKDLNNKSNCQENIEN